jgi:Uma2 family endonuclease
MASRLQIAPAEYLSTSFEGTDREYVRGEIVERSMPTYPQGKTQAILSAKFVQLRNSHHLFVCTETRMQLAPDLYRIPDIAVFAGTEPDEPVPSRPPLLVVEIISPDDRYSEVLEKLAEYRQWGVSHIWVVDPDRRTFAVYEAGALLPGYPLEFSADLFS